MDQDKTDLPWVEKYRPDDLHDIISHKEIICILEKLIENNEIPHMIFYGPPGTGKTTTILACAKKMYGFSCNTMMIELNGSDDRGIDVVRERIKCFSNTSCNLSSLFESQLSYNKKLVILDEADAMTDDAQSALRRIMDLYIKTTRFCLVCNYLAKIIPPLKSRCQSFRFMPLNISEHLTKINSIIKNESLLLDDDAKMLIIDFSDGDMRKSLNLLQSLYMMNYKQKITKEIIYNMIGYPNDKEKQLILDCFKKKTLIEIINVLDNILKTTTMSNIDIIRELTVYITKKNNSNTLKIINIIDMFAKLEINLSSNTNNNIHTHAIAAAIYNFNL